MTLPRLSLNVLSAAVLGVAFAYFEMLIVKLNPDMGLHPVYRVMYVILLVLPFIILEERRWPLGVADGLLAVTIEDLVFWIWYYHLPISWAWYYPVWHHVPLDDVIVLPVIVVLYYLAARGHRLTQSLLRTPAIA